MPIAAKSALFAIALLSFVGRGQIFDPAAERSFHGEHYRR